MRKLSKAKADLLVAIQADKDLTVWLYYSTQYNGSVERAAVDFVGKMNLNHRMVAGKLPRVADVRDIIPQFIAEYE